MLGLGTGLSEVTPYLDTPNDIAVALTGCGYSCRSGFEDPVGIGWRVVAATGVIAPWGYGSVRAAFGMKGYLPELKRIVPESLNFKDFGLNPYANDFADQLLEIMHNAEHIDFSISEMTGLTGPDGVLFGPKGLNPLGSTNWELRTIWDNLELRNKTTFYRDGKAISTEKILELE